MALSQNVNVEKQLKNVGVLAPGADMMDVKVGTEEYSTVNF